MKNLNQVAPFPILSDFLDASSAGPIIDVRSPGEYIQGHIPGYINIPLFDDDERALVGTCYKQSGHDKAVQLGLSLLGPKIEILALQLRKLQGTISGYECSAFAVVCEALQ